MKEDLNIHRNGLTNFWTIGYLIDQPLSQIILTLSSPPPPRPRKN